MAHSSSQTEPAPPAGPSTDELRNRLELALLLPSSQIVEDFADKQLIRDFFLRIGKMPAAGNLVIRLLPDEMVLAFHNKCLNIPDLLVVARATNGLRMGGYTSLGWSSSVPEGAVK